jgi:RHS repeat-associated protein
MSSTARRTSLSYPNGRVVNLGYGSTGSIDDLFSLVKSAAISGESGNKVEYTRAGLGRYVKIAYPQPGVEMSMIRPGGGSDGDSGDPYDGYDRFSRVQEMRWQNSSTGTPIDAWQWGYNEASNRTWKKNLVAASGQDEAYGYDGLYQVIRDAVGTLNTNRTSIGGIPGEEEDFTYDPTGNWLGYRKDTNGTAVLNQSRSNNQDNQLTQIDGSSSLLSYDRAGNATKTAPGTNGDWSKYYQPVWDAWNRLVEIKDETGASVQKNTYDGLSRRITKEAASVVTHTYWSDRWKPLEERVGSATTAARSYLWGERPGHRDELVMRDRDTDGNGTLDERLYATMDYFNGTAVMNTSGVVQERYAYSAFGVRRIMAADFSPRSTSSYAWDFGFQGQFRDSETGWYNYGFRFYVPLLGRWINRDPIAEDGGRNLYSFSENTPLNQVDYLGLGPEPPDCCKSDRRKWVEAVQSRQDAEIMERAAARSERRAHREWKNANKKYKAALDVYKEKLEDWRLASIATAGACGSVLATTRVPTAFPWASALCLAAANDERIKKNRSDVAEAEADRKGVQTEIAKAAADFWADFYRQKQAEVNVAKLAENLTKEIYDQCMLQRLQSS